MARRGASRGKRLVFVSHSQPDTWIAKQIGNQIEACEAETFLDVSRIEAGADFEEDIRSYLERADELLVLLTPWALERPYVWIELGAAWGRRIPIVALLLGLTPKDLQARADAPVLLKKQNLLQLNEIEVYIQQLKKRVKSH